jgi:hypothetical protein
VAGDRRQIENVKQRSRDTLEAGGRFNRALPLANWTREAANLFAASENFGFTNAVNLNEPPGEQKYLELWKKLPADPNDAEVRRNIAITQPMLWIK